MSYIKFVCHRHVAQIRCVLWLVAQVQHDQPWHWHWCHKTPCDIPLKPRKRHQPSTITTTLFDSFNVTMSKPNMPNAMQGGFMFQQQGIWSPTCGQGPHQWQLCSCAWFLCSMHACIGVVSKARQGVSKPGSRGGSYLAGIPYLHGEASLIGTQSRLRILRSDLLTLPWSRNSMIAHMIDYVFVYRDIIY